MGKGDDVFFKALAKSYKPVVHVARWLRSYGFRPLIVPPQTDGVDSGDIEIALKVEVKQRDIEFSGLDDYPFPDVFVDEKRKAEQVIGKYAYVICSKSLDCAAYIPIWTRRHWVDVKKFDSKEGKEIVFKACPVEHVQFVSLR